MGRSIEGVGRSIEEVGSEGRGLRCKCKGEGQREWRDESGIGSNICT